MMSTQVKLIEVKFLKHFTTKFNHFDNENDFQSALLTELFTFYEKTHYLMYIRQDYDLIDAYSTILKKYIKIDLEK